MVKFCLDNADNCGILCSNLLEKLMSTDSKKAAQQLVERYFFGQNNNELVIKGEDMKEFLQKFSELVISRTLDVAFNMKD